MSGITSLRRSLRPVVTTLGCSWVVMGCSIGCWGVAGVGAKAPYSVGCSGFSASSVGVSCPLETVFVETVFLVSGFNGSIGVAGVGVCEAVSLVKSTRRMADLFLPPPAKIVMSFPFSESDLIARSILRSLALCSVGEKSPPMDSAWPVSASAHPAGVG